MALFRKSLVLRSQLQCMLIWHPERVASSTIWPGLDQHLQLSPIAIRKLRMVNHRTVLFRLLADSISELTISILRKWHRFNQERAIMDLNSFPAKVCHSRCRLLFPNTECQSHTECHRHSFCPTKDRLVHHNSNPTRCNILNSSTAQQANNRINKVLRTLTNSKRDRPHSFSRALPPVSDISTVTPISDLMVRHQFLLPVQ